MRHLVVVLLFGLLALLVMSCNTRSSASTDPAVTIEPLPSSMPGAFSLLGGKPAAPPPPASTPAGGDDPAPTPQDAATAPAAGAGAAGLAPTEGRWIDVDITDFVVRLMDGSSVVREIARVAVGEQIDTGAYASTQTGLFHVYNKVAGLAYDAPYKTYISDWVGFDPDRANGFHSFLKDKDGNVVDASTGRVSNGCIRTGDAEELYAFAEIGMPVWVHL